MPKNGFATITVNEAIHQALAEQYSKHENELRILGINSLTGFVSRVMFFYLANHNVQDLLTDVERNTIDKILGAQQ